MADTTKTLVVYYHPTSYYSQRAILAAEEKGLEYKRKVINIHGGPNYEPWFLDISPMGEVPAIVHGDKSVADSNNVIYYLEDNFPESPRLQPDESTAEGQRVRHWRDRINEISIETITFASMTVYRDVFSKNSQVPSLISKMMTNRIKTGNFGTKEPVDMMEKYPKYKENYEKKLSKRIEFIRALNDLEGVRKDVAILDVILDELEDELRDTKKRLSEADDYWLLGTTFTVADVFVAVLLSRLRFIGLHHHFIDTKPLLTAYWHRLYKKPSFRVACVDIPSTIGTFIPSIIAMVIKSCVPAIIGLGVVTAAVYYGWKYMKLE